MIEHLSSLPRFEAVESRSYTLQQNDDGTWVITHPKGGDISVATPLAEAMNIAFKVQEKITALNSAQIISPMVERFALINCRKTAWLARHPEDLKRMTKLADIRDFKQMSLDEQRAISAIPELEQEVEAQLQLGIKPLIGTSDNLHIEEHLDELDEFPVVVHIFNTEIEHSDEIIVATMTGDMNTLNGAYFSNHMHQDHSFIVLGKDVDGRYACFHKRSPQVTDPFTVVDIETVLAFARIGHEDRIFVSMIGPLDSIEQMQQRM